MGKLDSLEELVLVLKEELCILRRAMLRSLMWIMLASHGHRKRTRRSPSCCGKSWMSCKAIPNADYVIFALLIMHIAAGTPCIHTCSLHISMMQRFIMQVAYSQKDVTNLYLHLGLEMTFILDPDLS